MNAEQPVSPNTYEGSCHCGALSYAYHTALPVSQWQLRACQCSFCRRHAALTTSDPAGAVEFRFARPEEVHAYRFAMNSADFLLCRNCGTYLGVTMVTPRGSFAVVNVRAMQEMPPDLPAPEPVTFDAESLESRIARRETRWTPVRGRP